MTCPPAVAHELAHANDTTGLRHLLDELSGSIDHAMVAIGRTDVPAAARYGR